MTKQRTRSIKFPEISSRQKKITAIIVISTGILSVGYFGISRISDWIAPKFVWPSGRIVAAEIQTKKQEPNISGETPKEPLQAQPSKQAEIGPVRSTPDVKTNTDQLAKNVDSIIISKIGAKLPIVTSQTANAAKLHTLLDSGVVLYPTSAKFGMIGQTILLGHSAPANWPKNKYDTAFSLINELIPGDSIDIMYGGKAFRYSVVGTRIIKKGSDLSGGTISGNSLVLVSCWPPGRNYERIVVQAALVSNQ